MANTIRDYSATAASNTTVDGADISEGCSPAGINNAIRGVMADLKDVSTGAVSLESPAADSLSLSGALTTTSTIDGRDVAADGTKLDGIEASADVTDAGNVNPLVDAHLNQSTASSGEVLSWNGSDYDWVTAGGGGDLLAANNLSDLDNAATARTNLGLGTAATTASTDYATAAQGTTADAALPRTGGAMIGAITTNSTFDGRDVATDGAKLDGIEASADVTDAGNVNPLVDAHLNTSTASASEVLSWTGTDYDWVAQSGGGGADLYAANESSPTAQPSATGGNAIAIGDSAVSSGTNSISIGFSSSSTGSQNVALGAAKATGTLGSLSLGGFGSGYSQASDSWAVAIGRSLASGNTSLAMNITDNTSSYGATGANSIAMGYRAKASGAKSIALSGENSLASGSKSFAAGGEYQQASGAFSVALGGSSSIASGESSYAFGVRSRATKVGQYAFGCWIGQQAGLMVLKADTTDATPKAMTSNNNAAGGTNQLILPDNAAYAFHGTIVARQKASEGTACAAWKVEGLIRREGSAATAVLVNSATTVLDNTPSWGMALSADTTNGALKIQVTGASSTNVKWTAQIHSAEITYA